MTQETPRASARAGGPTRTTGRLRSRTSLDFDWLFTHGDVPGAERPDFHSAGWRAVNLPHDWSIEEPISQDAPAGGAGGWFPGGIGWYRKVFNVPDTDAGRSVWIQFDGVYHNSDVWLNGHHLGRRAYGYVGFYYDVTPHLRMGGRNVLVVRVDNSDQPNCRWYSGSGIYRHVWLTKVAATHVAHWGTAVTTPSVSADAADVRLRTRVESREPGTRFELVTTIHDRTGAEVASSRDVGDVGSSGSVELTQAFDVDRPSRWSIDDPAMYEARSVVVVDGAPVDDHVTPFGIRDARFDPDRGLLLNGRPLKMKGVCLHHDGGAVGAAVPERVLERRLRILKDVGVNAIRTSHNPPAPEMLDLCDRMGFLVIDEAFDKWAGDFAKPKDWWMRQGGFAENWEQDLRAMLDRDRNHPSIILWSVGNETGQPGTDEVDPTLERLVAFTREHEPSRPVTCALVSSGAPTVDERVTRLLNSGRHVDVLSLNYQEALYPHLRAREARVVICGTETLTYWRGSEMNHRAYDPRNPWHDAARHDYVTGAFLWPGIDYLGESQSWPVKGWDSGIIDTCGFLKPIGWFHRSVWRPDEPVVRIAVFSTPSGSGERAWPWGSPRLAEHWNWPQYEGQLVRIQTQTNCETVELLLNGTSLGERPSADFVNRAVAWYVPYQPGTLEAVARNGGEVVARHELRTSGPAAQIVLKPDRSPIAADGRDVCHVVAQLVDAAGVEVRHDDATTLRFAIDGPADVLATDNGDLSDPTPYASPSRTTRGGRCLVLLRSRRDQPGTVKLTASAEGLPLTLVAVGLEG